MANDIVKDFVKKQTTPISIGVPKKREETPVEVPAEAPVISHVRVQSPYVQQQSEQIAPAAPKGKPGRPKSEIEKVKLSLYVPEEIKEKLIRIQHNTYRQSLNDVILEAVVDLCAKYKM